MVLAVETQLHLPIRALPQRLHHHILVHKGAPLHCISNVSGDGVQHLDDQYCMCHLALHNKDYHGKALDPARSSKDASRSSATSMRVNARLFPDANGCHEFLAEPWHAP